MCTRCSGACGARFWRRLSGAPANSTTGGRPGQRLVVLHGQPLQPLRAEVLTACSLTRTHRPTACPSTEVLRSQPYNEKCDVYSYGERGWGIERRKKEMKEYALGMGRGGQLGIPGGGAQNPPYAAWPCKRTAPWGWPELCTTHLCAANLLNNLRYTRCAGVILWELMTNEEPWHDRSAMQARLLLTWRHVCSSMASLPRAVLCRCWPCGAGGLAPRRNAPCGCAGWPLLPCFSRSKGRHTDMRHGFVMLCRWLELWGGIRSGCPSLATSRKACRT